MGLTNGQIAEFLALAAEHEEGHRQRPLQRAACAAMFIRTEEASSIVEGPGRSLTELSGVGPWLAWGILGSSGLARIRRGQTL
jgi:hypothetical protein